NSRRRLHLLDPSSQTRHLHEHTGTAHQGHGRRDPVGDRRRGAGYDRDRGSPTARRCRSRGTPRWTDRGQGPTPPRSRPTRGVDCRRGPSPDGRTTHPAERVRDGSPGGATPHTSARGARLEETSGGTAAAVEGVAIGPTVGATGGSNGAETSGRSVDTL